MRRRAAGRTRVLAMQEVMNHVIYELIFSASCLDCHLFLFERLGDLLTHWLAPLLPFYDGLGGDFVTFACLYSAFGFRIGIYLCYN
jgi:hypothetical protein